MKRIQEKKRANRPVTIYLIRHGETSWSLSGQHTSYTDLPLTSKGRRQARSLRAALKRIPLDAVFCSPLKRAFDTCCYAGLLKEALIDNDLVEWNYGAYEGITSQEIHKTAPDWTVFSKNSPGGETIEEIAERADRLLRKVVQHGGTVALFSSGHFSRALAARWLSLPVSYGQYFALSTASISCLRFEKAKPIIYNWNL